MQLPYWLGGKRPRMHVLSLIDLAEYEKECWICKGKGIPLMPVTPRLSHIGVILTDQEIWIEEENRRQAEIIYKRISKFGDHHGNT